MKTEVEKKHIPLFDLKIGAESKKQVSEVLKTGWLSTGPKAQAFEKETANYLGVENTLAVNSATSGLKMILTAVGAGPGKKVITTPFTFIATIEAILSSGAEPVFADIDPHTLCIDPDEIDRKATNNSTVVLPVDIAGQPCNYNALLNICDRKKLALLSDSAHSFGAKYQGKHIPQLTDASIYSFYSTKNLTCGEGGLLASKHNELIEMIRLVTRHGMTSNAFLRKAKKSWEYDVILFGTKGNMPELSAAVGLGQLKTFDKEQAKRKKVVKRYQKNLKDLHEYFEIPQEIEDTESSWHLFIIKLHLSRLKISRDDFITEMSKMGVDCGVHYKPVYEFSYYRELLKLTEQYFPNTAYAGRRVVSLPLYPHLPLKDVDYICGVISDIVKKFKT